MSDLELRALATEAGLLVDWIDAAGVPHRVSPDTLRVVLATLGLPAVTPDEIAASRRQLKLDAAAAQDSFVTVTAGRRFDITAPATPPRLILENGDVVAPAFRTDGGRIELQAPTSLGYHLLDLGDRVITLAVAPPRAWTLDDVAPGRKLWGLAAQLYALHREGQAFGDFAALAEFAEAAAAGGADAVAISPVHALFAADPPRYGPYAPSTRLHLNALFAPADGGPGDDGAALIDWPTAATAKLAALRHAFARFSQADGAQRQAFDDFLAHGGEALLDHARFEALHARFVAEGRWDWRQWPAPYRDRDGAALAALDRDHPEVRFHLFAQFLADRAFGEAQARAIRAGMAVGIVADMAVGVDRSGSQVWSRPSDFLPALSLGAPPDPFNQAGQNWGLSGFSPRALKATGFAGFLATMRAVMRRAGGIRIDHAVGLERIWVVPDGAGAREGVYLRYPRDDLLRLIALESHRHRAIVIAEDLGTVPEGLTDRLRDAGILGMRLLWFERDGHGDFKRPDAWDSGAAALTTTHDLPSVAGWWSGRDIAWRASIWPSFDVGREQHERGRDRARLWASFRAADCAAGDAPPPEEPEAAVSGALAYVGKTPGPLTLVPVEDILALTEQPNLPGTVDEHPNWRRRYPPGDFLGQPGAKSRLDLLHRARVR